MEITMNSTHNYKIGSFFRPLTAVGSLFFAFAACIAQDQLAINASFVIKGQLSLEADQPNHGGRSPVTFLKDSAGQQFVLKCNCSSEASIHEALGAYIGSSVGIPINKVRIIAPNIPFIGKKDDACIATLHTRVPGIEVTYINSLSTKCNIYNGLARRANLISCSKNNDLCDIVALDIFVDNFDRHNGNLFFDKAHNRFHAIDMDYIFSKAFSDIPQSIIDSPMHSIRNLFSEPTANVTELFLKELSQSATVFSTQEITALKRILLTLNTLIDNYSPKKIYALWMDIAQQSGYVYSDEKKNYIAVALLYNTYKVENCRDLLDTIIRQQS
jgi:hypothetical protein